MPLHNQLSKNVDENCYSYKQYAGISKSKFNKIKEIGLDAAFLASIDETDFLYSSETDTAEETDETCIPRPLTFIFKPSLTNFSKEVLINKVKKHFKLYKNVIPKNVMTDYQK